MKKNVVYVGVLIACIGFIKAVLVYFGPKLTHTPEPIEILYLFIGLITVFVILVSAMSWADKSDPDDQKK